MLAPTHVMCGARTVRPVTVGSLLLAERISMDLWLRGTVQERETALSRFLWSHAVPLDEVIWAVFADAWQEAVAEEEFHHSGVARLDAAAYLMRTMAQADACWVRLEKRRFPGRAPVTRPPADLVGPEMRASIVAGAAAALPGTTEAEWLWEVPLPRTLLYYHLSQWSREDVWTVIPRPVAPDGAALGAGAAELAAMEAAALAVPEVGELTGEAVPEWFRRVDPAG
jgi:hypothetical protein